MYRKITAQGCITINNFAVKNYRLEVLEILYIHIYNYKRELYVYIFFSHFML